MGPSTVRRAAVLIHIRGQRPPLNQPAGGICYLNDKQRLCRRQRVRQQRQGGPATSDSNRRMTGWRGGVWGSISLMKKSSPAEATGPSSETMTAAVFPACPPPVPQMNGQTCRMMDVWLKVGCRGDGKGEGIQDTELQQTAIFQGLSGAGETHQPVPAYGSDIRASDLLKMTIMKENA